MNPLRISVLVMLVGVLVAVQPAAADSMSGAIGESVEDVGSDSVPPDAEWYAVNYGVSAEEAVVELQLESEAGQLEVDLTVAETASFAGLWIEHDPAFRVNVAFTSAAAGERLSSNLAGSALGEVTVAVRRPFTLRELLAQHGGVIDVLRALEGEFDSRIAIQDAQIEILVASQEDRRVVEDVLDQLPSSVVVVDIAAVSQPVSNIYGGLALSSCTSGFTVKEDDGTRKGISTAGHCPDTISYLGTDLPWQNGQKSGNTDAQWHTAPGFTKKNWIQDGLSDSTTPYYREITGRVHRDNQAIGSTVCKYAKATGYGCGTLEDKWMSPSCITNATGTWMKIWKSGVDLAESGDSGGPTFRSKNAYGTISCQSSDGGAIYMAQNYMSNIGVHVWIGG